MEGHCDVVSNCTDVNLSTCTPYRFEIINGNSSTQDYLTETELAELYDEQGCFYTEMLRRTHRYETYMKFSLCMGIMTIVSGMFGLAGNLVNIIVLCSAEMRNKCFNNLLTVLNITDSLHIVFAILEVLRYDFPEVYQYLFSPPEFWAYIHYPCYRIALCASIYMIISVGIERYLAVCRPHHFRQVQTQNYRVLVYIIPAVLIAVLVSLPRFVEVETVNLCIDLRNCSSSCEFYTDVFTRPSEIRLNKWYIILYHLWFWIIVTGILPFIILTVINVRIFWSLSNLRKRLKGQQSLKPPAGLIRQNDGHDVNNLKLMQENRRRSRTASSVNNAAKECNMAIILICTTLIFLVLHLPRLLTSVYEAFTMHHQWECNARDRDFLPLWFLYCIAAMNTLLVLNASSNFLIYLFAGESFRSKFKEIILYKSLPSHTASIKEKQSKSPATTTSILSSKNNLMHRQEATRNIKDDTERVKLQKLVDVPKSSDS